MLCENKFAQGNMTWTCLDLRSIFHDFSQQASSFVQSTAVVFCHLSPRPAPSASQSLYNIISAVTALQAAAQLEAACLLCPAR